MSKYLKLYPFSEFVRRRVEGLTVREGFKLDEGVYLYPWINNLFDVVEENDSRGIGWRDCRVYNPDNEIKVHDDLYVLDTYGARTFEARALVYRRDMRKGLKNSEERMRYLLKKEPQAWAMAKGTSDELIYVPSFDRFIVSISPTHYLHFEKDKKDLAEEVAIGFHETMRDILKGRDPSLRQFLKAIHSKN